MLADGAARRAGAQRERGRPGPQPRADALARAAGAPSPALALDLFAGITPAPPRITRLHGSLARHGERVGALVREHAHSFKVMSKKHEEAILNRDCVQAR